MGTSDRLDEPYRVGGAAGPPGSLPSLPSGGMDPTSLPVMIDGKSYLIDTSRNTPMQERFRRQSVQLLNSQQNIDKGESALTTPEVWRRTAKSWHHGMGQRFADRDDSDEFRYDWSKGINPWERWEYSLLHETRMITDSPKTRMGLQANGHTVALEDTRRKLWLTDGTLTAEYSLGTVSVITTDGFNVYSYGADMRLHQLQIDNDGSVITVNNVKTTDIPLPEDVSLLILANYKLLAATASGKVYDVTSYIGGTPAALPAPIYVPPVPSVAFVSGCAGKKAIYMMAVSGDKTAIHQFQLTRDSGGGAEDVLLYSGVAAELPDGEIGRALYSYLGYVAIGTTRGFRFSAVGDGITYGPLIETSGPVAAFEGQDKYLYYSLPNYRGDSGIGRADLSQFVADLQPAYASDLMTVGSQAIGEVTFINTLPSGKMIFGVENSGIWQEQDTYVSSGEIRQSGWTFNVVDPKTGLYINTETSSGTGGKGTLYCYLDKNDNPIFVGEFQQANQRFELNGVSFYGIALHATMEPNPTKTATPKVYSTELRSTYVRGKASEWQVPCILHDEIEMDNGTVQGRDVIGDFQHLLSLVETGRRFLYIEEGQQWTVYATDFIWSPQERSQSSGWQGVFTIYFREVR
jgi:hypothetical protein